MSKQDSPLLGYNSNVRYKGRVFHVQTEDSGVKHPHVITHLYMDGGRILKTTRTSYAVHVGTEELEGTVRAIMKDQHAAMFAALRAGQLDSLLDARPSLAPPPAPPPPAPPAESARPAPPVTSSGRVASVHPPPDEPPPETLRESAPPSLTLNFDDALATVAFVPPPDLPPPPANVLRAATPASARGSRGMRDPREDPDSSGDMKAATPVEVAPRSSQAEVGPRSSRSDPRVDPESSGAMRAAEEVVAPKATPRSRRSARPPKAVEGSARPPKAVKGSARPPKAVVQVSDSAPRSQRKGSIFGDELISDKSLDEVILSYLSEDLDGDK